jgi:hypothetical protein
LVLVLEPVPFGGLTVHKERVLAPHVFDEVLKFVTLFGPFDEGVVPAHRDVGQNQVAVSPPTDDGAVAFDFEDGLVSRAFLHH